MAGVMYPPVWGVIGLLTGDFFGNSFSRLDRFWEGRALSCGPTWVPGPVGGRAHHRPFDRVPLDRGSLRKPTDPVQ